MILVALPVHLLTLCRTIMSELTTCTVQQTTAFDLSSRKRTLIIATNARLLHAFVLFPLVFLIQTGAGARGALPEVGVDCFVVGLQHIVKLSTGK